MQVSETTWDCLHMQSATYVRLGLSPDAERRGGPQAFFPKRRWLKELVGGTSACGEQLFHRLGDFRERRGFFEVTVD